MAFSNIIFRKGSKAKNLSLKKKKRQEDTTLVATAIKDKALCQKTAVLRENFQPLENSDREEEKHMSFDVLYAHFVLATHIDAIVQDV